MNRMTAREPASLTDPKCDAGLERLGTCATGPCPQAVLLHGPVGEAITIAGHHKPRHLATSLVLGLAILAANLFAATIAWSFEISSIDIAGLRIDMTPREVVGVLKQNRWRIVPADPPETPERSSHLEWSGSGNNRVSWLQRLYATSQDGNSEIYVVFTPPAVPTFTQTAISIKLIFTADAGTKLTKDWIDFVARNSRAVHGVPDEVTASDRCMPGVVHAERLLWTTAPEASSQYSTRTFAIHTHADCVAGFKMVLFDNARFEQEAAEMQKLEDYLIRELPQTTTVAPPL